MSTTSRYYQFELCLLAVGTGTPADRLNVITSYCAIDVGWPLVQKMTKEERWDFVSAYTSKKPEGFNYKTVTHIAILKGFEVLGMNGGVADRITKEHADSIDHINKMFKIKGKL